MISNFEIEKILLKECIKNLIFLIFVFFLISFHPVLSNEFVLECSIKKELENKKDVKNKLYKRQKLHIFIDKKNEWINDISFNDWKKKFKEDIGKADFYYNENNKKYYFKYKDYFTEEKKKLKLSSDIFIEKFGGYMEFIKYYYNFKNEVYFSTEVRGNCKKK